MSVRLIDLPTDKARAIKWQRGREKYGPDFVGDPVEELDGELLDAMNYAEEAARQGVDMRLIPEMLEIVRDVVQRLAK